MRCTLLLGDSERPTRMVRQIGININLQALKKTIKKLFVNEHANRKITIKIRTSENSLTSILRKTGCCGFRRFAGFRAFKLQMRKTAVTRRATDSDVNTVIWGKLKKAQLSISIAGILWIQGKRRIERKGRKWERWCPRLTGPSKIEEKILIVDNIT